MRSYVPTTKTLHLKCGWIRSEDDGEESVEHDEQMLADSESESSSRGMPQDQELSQELSQEQVPEEKPKNDQL